MNSSIAWKKTIGSNGLYTIIDSNSIFIRLSFSQSEHEINLSVTIKDSSGRSIAYLDCSTSEEHRNLFKQLFNVASKSAIGLSGKIKKLSDGNEKNFKPVGMQLN